MKNINIKDIKKFMSLLLVKDYFDDFLLEKADIVTYNTFSIDGHIKKDFYSKEILESLPDQTLSVWSKLKPLCFEIIRGTTPPQKFQLVFKAPANIVMEVLQDSDSSVTFDNICGLYMNIRYQSSHTGTDGMSLPVSLDCVSATSLNIFTLDKTIENKWDSMVQKLLLALI